MANAEGEIWEWVEPGVPDKRSDRGRRYYQRVSLRRQDSSKKRYFGVGDPVVMAGDDGQVWIAQIVNLFEAKEDDIHIKELMRNSTARNKQERSYELMRCTLRWFYNVADMNHHTLSTSRVSKPFPDEIWFSDHVEQDGFNDVQVIEGRAWLFPSEHAMRAFQKDPDPAFNKRKDRLRIVRAFVDSKSDHLPVRELERTELERLLRNPSTDKDLFENSRLRMYGSAGAVLKGTGKKKRRHTTIRSPVNVDEDEFRPNPQKKSSSRAVEAKVELGLKGAKETHRTKAPAVRRRKIIENDDDDDSSAPSKAVNRGTDDPLDDEPPTNRSQALDHQQQVDARRIAEANEEVFAWVTELIDNAYNDDVQDSSRIDNAEEQVNPSMAVEVNDVSVLDRAGVSRRRDKRSGKQTKEHKVKLQETETIIIDDDGDTDATSSRRLQRLKVAPAPRADAEHSSSSALRQSGAGRSQFAGKSRPAFMPTQRARKPSPTAIPKSTASAIMKRPAAIEQKKKSTEAKVRRQSFDKHSASPIERVDDGHMRKGESLPAIRRERGTRGPVRSVELESLAEFKPAMERVKSELAKMPSETSALVKGKFEWLVDTVIDKIFDGREERTDDLGDAEAQSIVDSTVSELQALCFRSMQGKKGSRDHSGALNA